MYEGPERRRLADGDHDFIIEIRNKLSNFIISYSDTVKRTETQFKDHETRLRILETFRNEFSGSLKVWGILISLLTIIVPLVIKFFWK